MKVSASSPGKINLFLDITAKRPDGYHEILTVFLPIHDLADVVTIEAADRLQISCSHPGVPCDEKNLCWQAVEKFSKASGCSENWHIHLDKKLPVAGGMGGGSSNAATVLRLLNEYNNNILSNETLREIALTIGADVPYFLKPVPALASGVGEDLLSLSDNHKIPLLLITFEFPISAAWAYQNRLLDFHASNKSEDFLKGAWQKEKLDLSSFVYNDLACAARRKFPILEVAIEKLNSLGAVAEVSGSGPTVFGAFTSMEERDNAYEALRQSGYPEDNLFKATAG